MRPPDDEHRGAAAVAALGTSPAVLRRLLAGLSGVSAWEQLRAGTHPGDAAGRHRRRAGTYPPDRVARLCSSTGTQVVLLDDPDYPACLRFDGQAPAVLFVTGNLGDVDRRWRVAVVGTRAPTPDGERTAVDLGHDLAAQGVTVVSGLARGIDAAVHRGVLAAAGPAPLIGVLGAAVDAPLSPPDDDLRRAVAGRGALLSEVPPGVAGSRWMYAVRNRVMAAMAHLVVVVESHPSGGSFHTVKAARRRGVPVMAIPGSVNSPASAGTNRLLVQGEAGAVCGADDVMAWLRRCHPGPATESGTIALALPSGPRQRVHVAQAPTAQGRQVMRVLDHRPATLDAVAARCGLGLGEVALALRQLADARLAVEEHGWWSRARP